MRQCKQLAGTLGPDLVCYLSPDDKARVPLGIAAATKQKSILMGLEYTKLPDHDWVVASGHKLIPSVYALCNIERGKFFDATAVKYSGGTKIVIRSGLHDHSTAFTHHSDVVEMIENKEFPTFTHMPGLSFVSVFLCCFVLEVVLLCFFL